MDLTYTPGETAGITAAASEAAALNQMRRDRNERWVRKLATEHINRDHDGFHTQAWSQLVAYLGVNGAFRAVAQVEAELADEDNS